MNSKSNLILLLIIALFLGALISRNGALALLALPFLIYLGAGLLTTPEAPRLEARRTLSQTRSNGEDPITMTLTIENQGPSIPRLRVVEPLHRKMTWVDGNLGQDVCLPAGQSLQLEYIFRAPRGRYAWQHVELKVSDPFGLFEKTLLLPAEGRVLVLPAQPSVHRLHLRPHHTIHSPGPNLSRLPGSGVDFWGVRDYSPGDPLRWIDWRKVARNPRQLFSKEFEREEMADIGLLLDARAVTNLNYGTKSLFEYSVEAAATLASLSIRAGNRVSLLVFGGGMNFVFPGTGKRQLVRLLDQLASCDGDGQDNFNTLKYIPTRLFPSRSLIVLISPIQAQDLDALVRLRSEGYQVILMSPNPVQYAALEKPRSNVTPYAVRAARLERAALLWQIRQIGVQVIDWPVDQPFLKLNYREPRA